MEVYYFKGHPQGDKRSQSNNKHPQNIISLQFGMSFVRFWQHMLDILPLQAAQNKKHMTNHC